jgi:hypothetical protein
MALYHESSLTTSRGPFEFCFSGKHVCDVVVDAIFSSLLGFINFLHLAHTHRDTAAAKPKTFVFEQRMLPKAVDFIKTKLNY